MKKLKKLLLCLGVGVFSLAAAEVSYNQLTKSVIGEFQKSQRDVCNNIKDEIEEEFGLIVTFLIHLASSEQAEMVLEQDVADLVAADKRYEESTKEGLPEGEWNDELLEHYKLQGRLFVNGFYFIDPKGICLARMPWRPGRIGRDFTDRPAIFKIVNQQYRGLLVTEKVDSVREKTPSIALSYGQVKNGELQIITRGIIHMDDFSSRFLKDLPAYSFSVINSSGIVIADTNADHINKDSADVDAHQDVNVIRIPLRYKDAVFILKMVPDIKGLNRTLLRFQLGAYLLFGALGLAFLTGLGLYRNRKQLKDELRERRKAEKKTFLHSEIMKNLSEGIYLMGLDDGIIRYANPKFEAMFGYETGEIIGKHISIVNAPGDKDPEETIRKVIEILGKTGEWHGEVDNIKKDGTLFCCQAHCSVLDHPDHGRVMVTIRTDITERKEMEGRLRQSEKMEAIGRLAGGVAHDFNNQLTGIMGFADLLVSRLDDEKLRKYAENIVRSAKRSAGLTEQLLAFSRKGKYASDPVDIHRIINEVMELLRHSIDKRIILKQQMAASSSIIKGDSTQLQNAFLNLALNACDAMPKGGDLLFSTETVTLDEDWCQKQTFEVVPGKYIRVRVQDSGVGIDPEIQKRIFEPFFTTKTEDRSIGMGLAAVYGTVKHHHGCILVESAPGRGSLFLFYLPLIKASARKGTEVQKTTSAGKAVRILVVDDNKTIRTLLTEMLGTRNYQVTTCNDGVEAVEHYRESWKDIDLVILDMVMPRMNGRDAFIAMRVINPDIKVLLSSGFSIEGDAQKILNEGVLGFLQKPYRIDELFQKVDEVLHRGGKIS